MRITESQLRKIIREALENDGPEVSKKKSKPRPRTRFEDDEFYDRLELAIQDAEYEEMDNLPYDPDLDDFYEPDDDGRYRKVYKRPRGYQDPMIREASAQNQKKKLNSLK